MGLKSGYFEATRTDKTSTFAGGLSIEGNMSFGDATTDTLSVTGASTFSNTITVGVNDTGYDVKFFGATSGAYMLWDESADDLILAGAAGLSVAGASSFTETVTIGTDKKLQLRDTGLYIYSSADGQLDIVADTTSTLTAPTITLAGSTIVNVDTAKLDLDGVLDVEDTTAGGSANGSIIKKTLQAGEDYTTTTAGLMVKNYGDATATVSSGEFTSLYVSLKGLHTDPGHNTSLISAHVHGDNTTTIWAGLWLYGDITNGIKASGSTLTNLLDISEATAVTNLMTLPAAGTDPVIANALVPAAAPDAGTVGADAALRVLVNGTPYYLALYDTLHA